MMMRNNHSNRLAASLSRKFKCYISTASMFLPYVFWVCVCVLADDVTDHSSLGVVLS